MSALQARGERHREISAWPPPLSRRGFRPFLRGAHFADTPLLAYPSFIEADGPTAE
ncbi:hypothetical protein [Actimicrobium sp. GrIS 1.19]|uniref:hypothetical protein n=1 Tax=Actimicrobium sp. GrIS 1.19 TaxID=3071708 RepID=UPI002E0FD44F